MVFFDQQSFFLLFQFLFIIPCNIENYVPGPPLSLLRKSPLPSCSGFFSCSSPASFSLKTGYIDCSMYSVEVSESLLISSPGKTTSPSSCDERNLPRASFLRSMTPTRSSRGCSLSISYSSISASSASSFRYPMTRSIGRVYAWRPETRPWLSYAPCNASSGGT